MKSLTRLKFLNPLFVFRFCFHHWRDSRCLIDVNYIKNGSRYKGEGYLVTGCKGKEDGSVSSAFGLFYYHAASTEHCGILRISRKTEAGGK